MHTFSNPQCSGTIEIINKKQLVLRGAIKDTVTDGHVRFVAAAPMDRRASFSGSGLPFANAQQAFENTPNKGDIQLQMNNHFEIMLESIPNSYYAGLGTVLIPPSVFIMYHNGSEIIKLSIQVAEPVAYRMLTYPMSSTFSRKSAAFYAGGYELPVRTQEQILMDSAYPSDGLMQKNFWGLRPRQ